MLAGFSGGAVLLAAASVAYACVMTVGRLNVTGANGGTSTAIGNGGHPGTGLAQYCVPPTNNATAPAPPPRATIMVAVASATDSACPTLVKGALAGSPNVLLDGPYDVMFCPGQIFRLRNGTWVPVDQPSGTNQHGSCFSSNQVGDSGERMGTLNVVGGSGSGTFTIPAGAAKNQPNNASGVSIRELNDTHDGPPMVNMVPISLI